MTKSLLLKGLGGVAAVGGVVAGGAVYGKDLIFGGSGDKAGKALNVKTASISHKELIDKVGLDCGLTGKEVTEEKECSVKSEGTITVKVGDQTEEEVTFTTSQSSKLKVRRSEKGGGGTAAENYNEGLKFVVDSGDISLTKKDTSASSATITKLEQFETYEIKEEGGKYFLLRKTKADVGIKNALGLGDLSLPTAGGSDTSNTYNKAENIKKIRFEGHSEGISVTSGEIKLKVSKTVDTTTFPFGYRFNFTFPADITINSKSLKGNIPYEFKIKKGTGNSLTLEQAWTDDNVLTKKAGLSCTNNECSVSSESQKLNVKVGHQKKEGITAVSTGKIKMEKDQPGYNQGLKFSIDGGNASLTGGTGDEITTLEELETYEIAEYEGKYYLTKKTSPDDLIKSTLVLPSGCELPKTDSPVSCTLNQENFKKINFDGKGTSEVSASESVTLTISKANSTDFPFGYKFTFSTTQEATVSSSNKIKKGIPTDFKIKKGTGSGQSTSLSLERAWNDSTYTLAAKVGLTCTGSGTDTCCTKSSGSQVKLNVKKGSDIKTDIDSVETSKGKIKVEKDKEGYNQGLKFTITTGDVTFTGGTGGTFSSLEELETYEITDEGGKYYLTRKTSKEDVLKTSLSIPEKCFKNLGTSCTLTSEDFKKISFDNKDASGASLGSGSATLTITKADSKDFPLGYRFTFNTTAEATIKTSSTKIKAKIPTDFKIKKNTSGQSTTLTLEKAWTDNDYSFAKKVGLQCSGSSGNECCTMSSGGSGAKLNVKKGNDKKEDITSINTGSGKIKVEKDKEGYNQGLKFTITGGSVTISNGTKASGSTNDITKLEELETYEITEEGGKYYLTRKSGPEDLIKSSLSLPSGCELPTGASVNCTLDDAKFKAINFDGKDNNSTSGSGTLTISKVNSTDFPFGYKFTFETTADATIKKDTTTIKAKIPTDFKIKKNNSNTSTLSLEKAWTAESLGKKVGLSCTTGTGGDECCSKSGSEKLNVKKGDDTKTDITSFSGSNGGKIKVEKDQEGYNQGLKFTISGGDVKITGGTEKKQSGSGEDLSVLDEYETYEIKEDGGKWYLTRKDESIVYIKKQLGLDFCTDNTWSRTASDHSGSSHTFMCNDIKLENLKKIKIKNASSSWPTGNINLQLTIERKKTNNANTYGEMEVKIDDQSSSESSVCIPDGNGGKVDAKSAEGAKYKINKGTPSWCLVKSSNGNSGSCTN